MGGSVTKSAFTGKKGDLIRMPRIGRLGIRPKQSGAPVFYQSRAEKEWSMIVDQYKESSFSVEDIAQIQANQDLRSIYTEEAGRALAEDIDNFILGHRASIKGANPSDQIVSSSPIAYADILAAWEILNFRKVPKEGRTLYIGAGHEGSMLNINQFIQNGVYNSGDIANIGRGTIGTILGMPVVMTTTIYRNSATGYKNGDDATPQPTPGMTGSPYFPTQNAELEDGTVTTASGLTANYHTAIICTKEWMQLAMQKMPNVDAYWDTDYQEWRVVQTQIYGGKVYRSDAAITLSTDEESLV